MHAGAAGGADVDQCSVGCANEVQEVVALGAHQVHLLVRVVDALADICRKNTGSANTSAEPVQYLTVKDHTTKLSQQNLCRK